MTDLRKAAEMALKAMDKVTGYMHDADYVQLDQAIDALRAALEQEKQELSGKFVECMCGLCKLKERP